MPSFFKDYEPADSIASGGSFEMVPTGSSLWKMFETYHTGTVHWNTVVSNRNPLPQRGTGHAFASSSPETDSLY